jgi:pimeloyl-ACP methyl ester carboxylesterase
MEDNAALLPHADMLPRTKKHYNNMNQTLKNRLGETLDYSFALGHPNTRKADWLIILGHGVTGDKDRPVVADTATALNAVGFDTLRFSFAGNGNSEGRFEKATISKEVADLESIIDASSKTYSNIAYIGHSMGGAVGVLSASKDKRIKALVSLAGMVDTQAFAQNEYQDVTPDDGFMWENEQCPLSSEFMHDLCQTIQSVEPLAQTITCPWLLLHGTADDIVLPKDTQGIAKVMGDSVSVHWVAGADHSFSESSHKSEMTKAVAEWMTQAVSK